jgi:hypothetical protein
LLDLIQDLKDIPVNAEIHFVSFDIKNIANSYVTKIIREKFWNSNNIQGEVLTLCSIILNENCFSYIGYV